MTHRLKTAHDVDPEELAEKLREAADMVERGGAESFSETHEIEADDLVVRELTVSHHVPLEETNE